MINLVLQGMGGSEDQNATRADGHFLAGLGVAADALPLLPHSKAPE